MHQQIWKRTDVKTQINEKIGFIVNGIRDLWIRGREVAESFFRVFGKNKDPGKFHFTSLRSRRLEVVGTKKKRAREKETCRSRVSLARARSLFRPLLPSARYAGYILHSSPER